MYELFTHFAAAIVYTAGLLGIVYAMKGENVGFTDEQVRELNKQLESSPDILQVSSEFQKTLKQGIEEIREVVSSKYEEAKKNIESL